MAKPGISGWHARGGHRLDKGRLAHVPGRDGSVQISEDEVRELVISAVADGPCAGPPPKVGIVMLPLVLAGETLETVVCPLTAKRLAVLVPWFEVQKGLVAVCEIP